MLRVSAYLFSLVLALSLGGLTAGCALDKIPEETQQQAQTTQTTSTPAPDASGGSGDTPAYTDLPTNPSVPSNPSGTSRQLWYFGYKDYDRTFRVRWPTYFSTTMGIGSGSYTMIDGQRAKFRSYDTDHGAKRPSYTISGPKSRFSGDVICILYTSSGTPVAWFRTDAGATRQGRLP